MNLLRIAVIGVGHLGRIHARLLSTHHSPLTTHSQLVAITDPSESAHNAVSAELNVPAFADYRELFGRIDAAIVAVPSRLHHAVAIDLLEHGIHTFIEKPITLNIADADDLIATAAKRGLALQVGHVERFNPAFTAVASQIRDPKYINAVRSGPFTCRSTDVGVVLDLMIHDLDLALSLIDDELVSAEALGAAVIGPNEDWAQARLTFANGCVANFFASRVAWQAQRSLEVITADSSASIDFSTRQAKIMRVGEPIESGNLDVNQLDAASRTHLKDHLFEGYLPLTDLPVNKDSNPLLEEQRSFIAAIHGQAPVAVTGSDGRRALDVAERILTSIAGHHWEGSASGPTGPRFQPRDSSILRGPHWRTPIPASRRLAG